MTLIFSYISPITGLFAVSDILISRPKKDVPISVSIPFRENPFEHSSRDYALAGTSQKSVIFGRTMISFADSVMVARAVIKYIREVSDDGQIEINLEKTMEDSGLSQKELDQVCLIYHFNPSGPSIVRTTWNCDKLDINGSNAVWAAGSGTQNFFENIITRLDDRIPDHEKVLQSFYSRLASHPVSEMVGTDSLDHLYGGWFELTYRDEMSFTKVPYAVRFWARKSGTLASGGPIHFGWYHGHDLNITRGQISEKDGSKSLMTSNFVVTDFLRRPSSVPAAWSIKPYFVIHVVFDEDNFGTAHILIQSDADDGMKLEVTESGFRVGWTDALRDKLLALGVSANQIYTTPDVPRNGIKTE